MRIAVVLVALVAVLVPGPAAAQGGGASASCTPLTVRQQAAQLLVVALPGAGFDAATERLVRHDSGGVVLLGRSIVSAEQLGILLQQIRDAAPLPPVVAVDEEGGRVARLGRAGLAPDLPSARDLAATRSPDQVRALGEDLGRALAAHGVTLNLAPVLDVTAAADATVIGDRSYSADPAVVATYGSAFAEGLQAGGVGTVGKHWPGHGRTEIDSHLASPVVDVPVADLLALDAVPYRAAAHALDAVMLSHLRIPQLDPVLPASLSPAAIALLREDIGWRGPIMTDDLAMRAVTDAFNQPEAAELALGAGQDLLVTSDAGAAAAIADRLAVALASGRVPQARLHDALRRVLPLRGIADADVTCLLGLPPAAEAPAVRGEDGFVYSVTDGTRHAVPDAETLAALGLEAGRYAQAEVDALPLGAPLQTERRFAAVTLAGPGDDPAVIALARSRFQPDGSAPRVVVATANGFADALAGAPLLAPATPLLLARPDLTESLAAEVDRVLAPGGTVYLLGGEAALGRDRLGAIADRDGVVRLSGPDRYATAAAVYDEVTRRGAEGPAGRRAAPDGGGSGSGEVTRLAGDPERVLLVRGDDWPDAIAAAPLAAARGWPVLLTTPDALPAPTAERLSDSAAERRSDTAAEVVAIGGDAAISPAVAAQAGVAARWAGDGREATAAAVAREGWGHTSGSPGDGFLLVEAAGTGWAHALAATPFASGAQAPLLLAPPGSPLGAATRNYLEPLGYPAGATAIAYLAGLATPTDLFTLNLHQRG